MFSNNRLLPCRTRKECRFEDKFWSPKGSSWKFKDVLQALGVLKEHSNYRSKVKPSHTKNPWDVWPMYQNHSRTIWIDYKIQQNIIALSMDEMSEWCYSCVLVPKPNGKVRLCFDLVRLNQALIRPVHRGPATNDIFPKLTCMHYFALTGTSSKYHSLKLDKRLSLIL